MKTNKILSLILVLAIIASVGSVGAAAYYKWQVSNVRLVSARIAWNKTTEDGLPSLTLFIEDTEAEDGGDYSDQEAVIPVLSGTVYGSPYPGEPAYDESGAEALPAPKMVLAANEDIDAVTVQYTASGSEVSSLVEMELHYFVYDENGELVYGVENFMDTWNPSRQINDIPAGGTVDIYASAYIRLPDDELPIGVDNIDGDQIFIDISFAEVDTDE